MRRELVAALVGAAVVAVVGTVVVLVDERNDDHETVVVSSGTATEARTIEVTGVGTVTVKPDTARVNVGVRVSAATASAALDRASVSATALIAAVKDAGVSADDITTTDVSVYPMYSNENIINSYVASNSLVVTIRDIDRAGEIIDAAATAAGDDISISGIMFFVDETETVIGAARTEAIENARSRAQAYATGGDVTLGEVLRISETSSRYWPAWASGGDMEGGGVDVPIETGTQDLSVDVLVVFAIDE
jgi:uncharacterized protein YggE